jgi:hypothetical protein
MGAKSLAMIAAACAASLAAPCHAQQLGGAPMTTFFMEIPLDAKSPKEQAPNFGLQFRGSQPYQSLRIDQRMFDRFKLLPAVAGIEATWIIAGAVGVVAVASIAHKDKGTTQQLDQQKQQQLEACPDACAPK